MTPQEVTELSKHPDLMSVYDALALHVPHGEFRSIGVGMKGDQPCIYISVGCEANRVNAPSNVVLGGHIVLVEVQGGVGRAYAYGW